MAINLVKSATLFELSPTLAANELVTRMRAQGREILHMGFGESPFPPPPRLQQSLRKQAHRKSYLDTAGLAELRQVVLSYFEDKGIFDTENFDVLIAPGSKLVLYALQMAVDGAVLIPVPSWVSYRPQARMLGSDVIDVPAQLDDEGFHINVPLLRDLIHSARAAGKAPAKLIVNTPSNPTGLMIPEHELKEIAALCVEEDIFIISDEIYGFTTFDEGYKSIAKFAPTHTAVTSGLSKQLSLGGWRIGIGFIPKAVSELYPLLRNIASETWSCVPAPIQYAALQAYQGHADVEAYMSACTDIHKLANQYVAARLQALEIKAPSPQGGFYNYPDFEHHRAALNRAGIYTSQDLANTLLRDYGLVSIPGVAFGTAPEALTLRLSGVDYNGAAALEAYEGDAVLDEDFVETYMPHIKAATEVFCRFIDDINQESS